MSNPYNAPNVVCNTKQYAATPTTAPSTDALQQYLARQVVTQYIPVYGPAVIGLAPEIKRYRGWTAPHLPNLSVAPSYPYPPTQAPDISLNSGSYATLIANAANPPQVTNRPAVQLSAPGINQGQ